MRHLFIAALLVAGSLLAVQTLVALLEQVANARQERMNDASFVPQAIPAGLPLPLRQQAASAGPELRLSAR